MAIRSYPTGTTHTFRMQGTLTLKYCGGKHLVPGFAADAYTGSEWFRPVHSQGDLIGEGQAHAVLCSFGAASPRGALIRTYLVASGPQWITEVRVGDVGGVTGDFPGGGVVAGSWVDEAAPETVNVSWSSTFTAAEWIEEIDDRFRSTGAGVRPSSAYSAALSLYWVPQGSLVTSVTGAASYTMTESAASVLPARIDDREETSLRAYAYFNEWYVPGLYEMYPLTPADGTNKSGLPWPAGGSGIEFARVDGLASDGTVSDWSVVHTGVNFDAYPSRSPHNVTTAPFMSPGPGFGSTEYAGQHGWDVPVRGVVRDWNGSITNVPVEFSDTFGDDVTVLMTGSATIDALPETVAVHAPAGYSSGDHAAQLLYGPEWASLSVNRLTTIRAEDFTKRSLPNGWVGTNATLNAPGSPLVATASGASPRIDKTLKSDYDDIQAGPSAWWTLHGGSQPTSVADWWALGVPERMGKRLLSTSDVFNWASYRYADLTASLSTAGTITLTVVYAPDPITGEPESGLWLTAAFPIAVGTGLTAHRIDFASRCGHDGLRYVKRLRIDFPAGATLTLQSLDLVEVGRPTVEVHHPTGDPALITALADGKHALFLRPRPYTASVWGWPTSRDMPDGYQCYNADELALELSMQEGWTATAGGGPDHGTPNSAAFLAERFGGACPVSLTSRRSFGSASPYAHASFHGFALDLRANLGSGIHVLVFDPDTRSPVHVPVEVRSAGGVLLDGTVTDGTGAGRLEVTREAENVTVTAGPGTADASSQTAQPTNRTLYFPALTAKEAAEGGTGPVVIDIDRSGNAWLTHVTDSQVKVERRLAAYQTDALPAFQSFPIGAVGSDPWIHVDETHPEMRVNVVFRWGADTLYQASSAANGTGDWRLLMIGTGGHPFIRKDKASGITFYLYWRGGTVYLKRSPDDGNTFLESEITVLTSAVEATYTLDFRLDPAHTIEMPYSDGTDIHSRISVDNGRTWADG